MSRKRMTNFSYTIFFASKDIKIASFDDSGTSDHKNTFSPSFCFGENKRAFSYPIKRGMRRIYLLTLLTQSLG